MERATTGANLICGIDIGGTFTDLVLFDLRSRVLVTEKVLTTPDDPSEAVSAGLERLLSRTPRNDASGAHFVHATTLVTNALIERRGARSALVTTKGFRDVLDMRRGNRYDIFDLALECPEPLVAPELRWEVRERVTAEGEPILSPTREEVVAIAREIAQSGAESVAVVFLHAYAHPAHEEAVAQSLQDAMPTIAVCRSSEVAPQIREYERACTTAVNAYGMPLIARYLERLSKRIESVSEAGRLTIMVSDGGTCSVETARRFPVRLLESGPAAGVLSALEDSNGCRERNVLAFDMGGTTAKLCILRDGRPTMTDHFEAARVSRFQKGSGIPVSIPSIDLVEIGAGGGSIAHVDEIGMLQVGPRSAGSSPGPACYGFGAVHPTVTDADLLLGYLDPDYFLGGTMRLDAAAAASAVRDRVAAPLGLSTGRAAWGIHDLVNENMAIAARLHLAGAGLDPRTFALVATGGAGPLHGVHLAAKLGITHVLCPPSPGVASAYGLLVAPMRVDLARSYLRRIDEIGWPELAAVLDDLASRALAMIDEAGAHSTSVERVAQMSYVGQTHQIDVTLPRGPLNASSAATIRTSFEERYKLLYGAAVSDAAPQIVGVRVTASGPKREIERPKTTISAGKRAMRLRAVTFTGSEDATNTKVLLRGELESRRTYTGPAVVADPDSSLVIDPGWEFSIDDRGVVHVMDARRGTAL